MNKEMNNKGSYIFIGVVSILVPFFVSILFFYPEVIKISNNDYSFLPRLNAILNTCTTLLLIFALYFIKKKNIKAHSVAMLSAVTVSVLFLASYVTYHSQMPPTHFGGEGLIKIVYYILLISHIILATIVIPFVLFAVYFGLTELVEKHKKVVRWAYPIWLYVSTSGVAVYLLISPYYK